MKNLIQVHVATLYLVCWGACLTLPLRADDPQASGGSSRVAPDHLEPAWYPRSELTGVAAFVEAPSLPDFGDHVCWIISESENKYFLKCYTLNSPESTPYWSLPKADSITEIPKDIVILIRDIWMTSMFEVRYSKRRIMGCDGVNYTFSVYTNDTRTMHGMTWSPGGDLPPRWMVELGKDIFAYGASKEKHLPKLRKSIEYCRSRLLKYLESKKNGAEP